MRDIAVEVAGSWAHANLALRRESLREAVEWVGLPLTDEAFVEFEDVATRLLAEMNAAVRRILPEAGELASERNAMAGRTFRIPRAQEDPLNALSHWCGGVSQPDLAEEGVLSGQRVAVKDLIAVAGVPLLAGSDVLEGFVPTVDAVVVDRIIQAGGEIVATTNMDYLALSGGGDTSALGPTLNPFDRSRSTAGSSGGSAAALFYPQIDLTLGCDQGGSVRAPAAWCGVLGLKPTFGLVPYVGILGLDPTFDHCGPMARTTEGLARLLQAIAGPDRRDPRQVGTTGSSNYLTGLDRPEAMVRGLRVGVVDEGLSDESGTTAEVAEVVQDTASRLAKLGAVVRRVSVPGHDLAGSISNGVLLEGASASFQSGGMPPGYLGAYWDEACVALGRGLTASRGDLSLQVQMALGLGAYLTHRYRGTSYVVGRAALDVVKSAYDRALADHDVLLIPTVPWPAHEHDPNMGAAERLFRGWALLRHTSPTNATGHPALSMPVGEVNGLPVGVMAVARPYGENTLLGLAANYEREFGWRPSAVAQ